MVNVAERAFDTVFPSAEELWEKGGATIIDDVPYFMDLDIDGDPTEYARKNIYSKEGLRRKKIGSSVLLAYTMNDGIDRLVNVRMLDDDYRSSADMLVTTSTAWTTTPPRTTRAGTRSSPREPPRSHTAYQRERVGPLQRHTAYTASRATTPTTLVSVRFPNSMNRW